MNLFFELLRVALGTQEQLSRVPTEQEWREIITMLEKQTLVGIGTKGVQQLPEEQRPPKSMFLHLIGVTMFIQQRNQVISESCGKIQKLLRKRGLSCCMIKGQGIGAYYGDLSAYRCPGDIDLWGWPADGDGAIDRSLSRKQRRQRILAVVRKIKPSCNPVYHNVSLCYKNDVVVEVHFTPSWFFSPIHNLRLQRWMEKGAATQFSNLIMLPTGHEVTTTTLDFNRVHVLQHIYRHLFGEGIGLRQIMDYYFVLRASCEYDKKEVMTLLRSLGTERFAKALMWILKEVFGLEDEYLLCETDETEGRFLLNEIMLAGNFGAFDERIDRTKYNGLVGTFCKRTRRNMMFITHYPSEVLWSPLWKVWHQLWLKSFKKK